MEVTMGVLKIIAHLVKPSSLLRLGLAWVKNLGRRCRSSTDLVSGSDGLNSQQLRDLGTGQETTERVRGSLPECVLFFFLEATVADAAKVVRVHASILCDAVDFLHGHWVQLPRATVDEGSFVRILTGLAVVKDELELRFAWFILSDNIPVLPEFCRKRRKAKAQ